MTATPFSRVYGVSLGTHLQEHGRDIALPIEACVLMLSHGMKEEVASALAPTLGAVPTTGGGTQRTEPRSGSPHFLVSPPLPLGIAQHLGTIGLEP